MNKETVTNLVIGVVIVIWSAAAIVGMLNPGYQMSYSVQFMAASVAAYLFGQKWLKRDPNRKDNEP